MSKMVSGNRTLLIIILIILAVIGVGLVLFHTQDGPGLASDSAVYLQGAESLRAGSGYSTFEGDGTTVPITGFPPVFSAVLALFGLGGQDLIQAGRWVNAVAFGANIFLAGLLIFRSTRSFWASCLGSLMVLAAKTDITGHSWVMTEALFILFMLIAIYLIDLFLEKKTIWFLVGSAFAQGLLVLTRYAGLALVIASGLTIVLLYRSSGRERLFKLLIFWVISLLPVALWLLRNMGLAGTAVDRATGVYTPSYDLIMAYINEWTSWLFPTQFHLPWRPRVLATGLLTGLIALPFLWKTRHILQSKKQAAPDPGENLPWFLMIFLVMYGSMLIANEVFLTTSTHTYVAGRYLLPAFIAFIIFAICTLSILASKYLRWPGWKIASLIYGIVLLAFYVQTSFNFLRDPGYVYGLMDQKNTWTAETDGLEELDASRPLFSTNPELLYILVDRPSYRAPWMCDGTSGELQVDQTGSLEEMMQQIQGGAFLVVFSDEVDPTCMDEMTQGLETVLVYSKMAVYQWPEP